VRKRCGNVRVVPAGPWWTHTCETCARNTRMRTIVALAGPPHHLVPHHHRRGDARPKYVAFTTAWLTTSSHGIASGSTAEACGHPFAGAIRKHIGRRSPEAARGALVA